jgi:DNA-binding transcriptional LysR family regulator
MQRLEDVVGQPLLAPSGRHRALTLAGEELAGHARRILEAHRTALLSLKGSRAAGRITVAATQDFAESGLPRILRLFAQTHLRLGLDLRIGRSAELIQAFEAGEIDVLLTMRLAPAIDEIGVLREPMIWLASSEGLVHRSKRTQQREFGKIDAKQRAGERGEAVAAFAVSGDELPLALLDPPCGFRAAALAALDRARRPYRIAATSQSLSGLRAAVSAGLAVTLRTARWIGPGVSQADKGLKLPEVGDAVFAMRVKAAAPVFAQDLGRLLREELAFGS